MYLWHKLAHKVFFIDLLGVPLYADFKAAKKSISKIEALSSKSVSSYQVHNVLGPKRL